MDKAVILTNGLLEQVYAKTTHGLVRGPSRYEIVAVVDPVHAGRDAGEVLDARHRGIPILASVGDALALDPQVVIVGVATEGGVLPPDLRDDLMAAARSGLTLVNGLHQLLSDDHELARVAAEQGGGIIDIRKSPATADLRFWTGDVLKLETPRVAVLGTDCALGKRTTSTWLASELRGRGLSAEVIFTGQTGWLQGHRHGFILDSTPNDFVSGELERVILECADALAPDLMLLEGQASLRNPSGPCGSELIVSAGARGVVLQHAPLRRFFAGFEDCVLPPLAEEIEIIRLLGGEVWAVTLNEKGLAPAEAEEIQAGLAAELGVPVARPLTEGVARVADEILRRTGVGMP